MDQIYIGKPKINARYVTLNRRFGVKLFSSKCLHTSEKETSETTCEIP